jgi:hypothetical protein
MCCCGRWGKEWSQELLSVEIVDGGSEGKLQTRKHIEIWFERKEEEEELQELILVHVSSWVACSKCLGKICSGFGSGIDWWELEKKKRDVELLLLLLAEDSKGAAMVAIVAW